MHLVGAVVDTGGALVSIPVGQDRVVGDTEGAAWAAGYNVVAIPVAAGALTFAGITMPPAVGAILMSVSTIVVALNAQLLRRVKLLPNSANPSAGRDQVDRT